jgi:hypothetical protein
MKRMGFVLLFPTLKVAQFLGLLPCCRLQTNRLRHSKSLCTATSFLFIVLFVPAGIYYLLESIFKPASDSPVGSGAILVCVIFSNVISIIFPVIYCWHFISNSCSVLSKATSAILFAEKQTGARMLKFQLLILTYQCVGLVASFSMCLTFVIRFSVGTNWQMQFVLNFTRMQIYTIEQTINVLNFIFAIYFQQISNGLKCRSKKSPKIKVE